MAKKDPHASIQFYIGDRLKELMPIYSDSEAIGAWTKAWMYLWDNGPTRPEVLQKVVGSGWETIGFLFTETDGLFSLDWVEEKRAETAAFKARQKENGAKGGRPKSRKLREKNPLVSKTKPKKTPRGECEGECEGEREGEREGEGKERATADPITATIWPAFDDFWDAYGKKIDRPKCEAKWERLDHSDRVAIMDHVPRYVQATPDTKYRRNPLTYLNGQNWNDDELTRTHSAPAKPGTPEFAAEQARKLAEHYNLEGARDVTG